MFGRAAALSLLRRCFMGADNVRVLIGPAKRGTILHYSARG